MSLVSDWCYSGWTIEIARTPIYPAIQHIKMLQNVGKSWKYIIPQLKIYHFQYHWLMSTKQACINQTGLYQPHRLEIFITPKTATPGLFQAVAWWTPHASKLCWCHGSWAVGTRSWRSKIVDNMPQKRTVVGYLQVLLFQSRSLS